MKGYLGEQIVDVSETPFKNYTSADWALYFIERYGCIDGEHHKNWVLDQVTRILNGTAPLVKLAKWANGHQEYRVNLLQPSAEYHKWVDKHKDGEEGANIYDIGVAP